MTFLYGGTAGNIPARWARTKGHPSEQLGAFVISVVVTGIGVVALAWGWYFERRAAQFWTNRLARPPQAWIRLLRRWCLKR